MIRFDESTHTYYANGVVVPSVTQVIGAIFPELYAHSNVYAMERGSAVHEATSYYDDGDLEDDSVSDEVAPFLAAYKRFLIETGFTVEMNETRLYSALYGYAGTLDRVGRFPLGNHANLCLMDIKTGDPGWQAGLQTAAYAHAVYEQFQMQVDDRCALWLKADGTYRIIDYPDFDNDFADFAGALRVYRRKAA